MASQKSALLNIFAQLIPIAASIFTGPSNLKSLSTEMSNREEVHMNTLSNMLTYLPDDGIAQACSQKADFMDT